MSPNGTAPLGWGSYEQLPQGRTLVMGILNVTPDSFSDGGTHDTVDTAIAHGLELAAQGADIVDVGGDSTRPGSVRVSLEEEQRRILEVIRALSEHGIVISVDTLNAETAAAALDAGAHIINDVSGMNVQQDMIDYYRSMGRSAELAEQSASGGVASIVGGIVGGTSWVDVSRDSSRSNHRRGRLGVAAGGRMAAISA